MATDWDPPKVCPQGHVLVWPNVVVSWGPCDCARAEYKGHRTVLCWTCRWKWYEGGCDATDGADGATGPATAATT